MKERRTVAEIAAMLEKLRCCRSVVERVLRLNPNGFPLGQPLRGWHRHQNPKWNLGLIGKGEFIRKYGRQAWDRLPRCEISRIGKRKYVTRTAVEDCLWLAHKDSA